MNLEYFIAKNIVKGGKNEKRFTKPVIRISIAAIALGLTVMIASVAIVLGFQREIRSKVIGFGSHIQVTNFDSQSSFEASPVSTNQDFYPSIDTVPGIRHIQVFANKAGIIKTNEDIYGVVVKGVGSDFDWSFFEQNLVEGEVLTIKDAVIENEIMLSKAIANKMQLKVGDKSFVYFIQKNGKLRPKDFIVTGIYESGLEQFDNLYVVADIAHIQKRNGWPKDLVGGFEILIEDYDELENLEEFVYNNIGYHLNSTTIVSQNPEIFNWLELQDLNIIVIIVLMIIVAVINIISALLILILERTNMIGILKSMGMANWNIRKIFMYNALYLVLKGLFWGNAIGLLLCVIQNEFKILKLPQESYYVSEVPIEFNFSLILALNIGTLLVCGLMMIIPSYIVARISPIKAIRFD